MGVPGAILPAIVFIFAAFLSFSTGTSWGTFGILLPIVAPVAQAIAPQLIIASLAATLAGSIFGDHCSPISDTTILSSTGASCNHLDHVNSQMPYALTLLDDYKRAKKNISAAIYDGDDLIGNITFDIKGRAATVKNDFDDLF